MDTKTLSAKDFIVTESKNTFNFMEAEKGVQETENQRKVLEVFTSDEKGYKKSNASEYITLTLKVGPTEGRYFYISPETFTNRYPDIYKLDIKLVNNASVTSSGSSVSKFVIKPEMEKLYTSVDNFAFDQYTASDGTTYQYAFYNPTQKSETLIVWLHGLGEGGVKNTDSKMPLLGNEAAILGKEEFQNSIGGANILVPQSPSFWMDKTGQDSLVEGRIISNGSSYYTKSLHELIAFYKEKTGSKKIIIAGCSNGGFMGMLLAKTYATEYDGYVLICEAMEDKFLTDEDIQTLKDLPLYFVYSKDDPLVVPQQYEEPTIQRLKLAGATKLETVIFDSVVNLDGNILDEEGKPYNFGGHSSWVYFFNNEVVNKDGQTIWEWISERVK
ncbi:alpha/beta hydrolase [Streptococcus marmotae]|nr:alpha/beta hydrolase [Streptococcus marmotae]